MSDKPTTTSTDARNVHQRIAAITGEAQVKITGRNAQGKEALSIADVDRILGDLMAKHGVTSRYSFLSEPTSYEEKTRNGSMTIWRVNLAVFTVNADDPKADFIEDTVYDDASNVSGAVSFALKRYLRALFKLAEDDTTPQLQARGQQGQGYSTPRAPRDDSGYGQQEEPTPSVASTNGSNGAEQIPQWRRDLHDLAVRAGKDAAWVDDLMFKQGISAKSVAKKLEQVLAKKAQNGELPPVPPEPVKAGEPKAEKDPNELVCPGCGRSEAMIPLADEAGNESGRIRCSAGSKGGCAATFHEDSRVTRADWEKWKAEAEAAGEPTTRLEELVDQAGVRPASA